MSTNSTYSRSNRLARWLAPVCVVPAIVAAQPDCAVTPGAQNSIEFVDSVALLDRLRNAPTSNAARRDRIEELFETAGCRNALIEQTIDGTALPNLVCTLPGASDRRIVIGAHYDKVKPGRGIADNWSGAAMLPALYETLRRSTRRHTLEFVAFSAEERGEIGSRAYVDSLNERGRKRIMAMVNLDTLGLGTTQFEAGEANGQLACRLTATAASTGIDVVAADLPSSNNSDHEPFRAAGIPAIHLHTITGATKRIVHGRADRYEAIDTDRYLDSYRLIATYLEVIDESTTMAE